MVGTLGRAPNLIMHINCWRVPPMHNALETIQVLNMIDVIKQGYTTNQLGVLA